MMSSTVWTRLVLSPATLHSVSSIASCYRVTWHCSGVRRVIHSAGAHCRRTVDACLYALQVLTTLSVCTSCSHLTALT
jgi:hypothetical protein